MLDDWRAASAPTGTGRDRGWNRKAMKVLDELVVAIVHQRANLEVALLAPNPILYDLRQGYTKTLSCQVHA